MKSSSNSISRRDLIKKGIGLTAAGLFLPSALEVLGFPPAHPDDQAVDFIGAIPASRNRLDWKGLESWLTPHDQVFNVQHYGIPEVDADTYRLEITGLVDKPFELTLEELKSRPAEKEFTTLECAGNGASPGFMDAVYNSEWTGTPLAGLLEEAGVQDSAREIVFFGHDTKEETLRPGTNRELKVKVPFGRSMSIEDVRANGILVAWARNGEPLTVKNGFPVRLIVPGWYGVANVKWLKRIDVRDRRYMGRYMGRDYVTVRGERIGEEIVFVESSVTRMRVKSIIARVTQRKNNDGTFTLRVYGAAWGDGSPMDRVEVQLNDGEWKVAQLDAAPSEQFSWKFFSLELDKIPAGKHKLISRAIDNQGRIQPSADDDSIALKKTYWEANQQWPREFNIG